jgi:alanyl-tRNA synthetase
MSRRATVNLESLAQGVKTTDLLYLKDSYLKEATCSIVKVEPDDRKSSYLILDRSIFHPKSGGQPSDRGKILTDAMVFDVRKVMITNGVAIHWGKHVKDMPQVGQAKMQIEWDLRYRCMRKHTAAHLFDHCLAKVLGRHVETTDSWVGDGSYIGYRGELPPIEKLQAAEAMENMLIERGARVTSQLMTREQAILAVPGAPNIARLPPDEYLRVVTIEGCEGIPCGGTHVNDIREIGQFQLGRPEALNDRFKVTFDVKP